ncbi:hypothetical protein H7H98_03235 [Mycolicibacterium sphagni]|nr:hypothetical protein [Mycolicibacterium sphagni]
MGWAVGFDTNLYRDIGYGVPAICEHPDCDARIDRGLAYGCGGGVMSDEGCALYFCHDHLGNYHDDFVDDNGEVIEALCERCAERYRNPDDMTWAPFRPKPDLLEWLRHKLTDGSWGEWRLSHPGQVEAMREALNVG